MHYIVHVVLVFVMLLVDVYTCTNAFKQSKRKVSAASPAADFIKRHNEPSSDVSGSPKRATYPPTMIRKKNNGGFPYGGPFGYAF